MKKILVFGASTILIALVIIRCNKPSEKKIENQTEKSSINAEAFANHLISSSKAQEMIERYDNLISADIANKYKLQNKDYIAPLQVSYKIETLLNYLLYLKENGADEVSIRYAAKLGEESDLQIPGLPYHTLIFFGKDKDKNTIKHKSNDNILPKSMEQDQTLYFDQGQITPPPYKCPHSPSHSISNCPKLVPA